MNEIEVLVPVAPLRIEQRPLAPRLRQLRGARIGWLDNSKANAGALLAAVADALRMQHDFATIVESKDATAAAPELVMAHLQTCDAVVLAIAD